MARSRCLTVKSLPQGKDRADLLDLVRSEQFRKGLVRVVFEDDGRVSLIYTDADLANDALKAIHSVTAIDIALSQEEPAITSSSRQNTEPNPVVWIAPDSTPLDKEELRKILQCYRGLELFGLVHGEPPHTGKGGPHNRARTTHQAEVPYACFRDVFCAENAVEDLSKHTNLVSGFANNPGSIRKILERKENLGRTSSRVSVDRMTWIIVSEVPDDVALGSLRRHFGRLDGFVFLGLQPEALFLGFQTVAQARKAADNLIRNTRMKVRPAHKRDVQALHMPPKCDPSQPTAVLIIRSPPWLHQRRVAELLQLYEGFQELKPGQQFLLAKFETVDQASRVLKELEATTNLQIRYSKPSESNGTQGADIQASEESGAIGGLVGTTGSRARSNSVTSISSVTSITSSAHSINERATLRGSSSVYSRPSASEPFPFASAMLINVSDLATVDDSFRHLVGKLDGFERMAFYDEGCYSWFATRELTEKAASHIEAERHITPILVEKRRPRQRAPPIQPPHAEQYAGSLFVRCPPGLTKEALQLILEHYPGYVACRHLRDAIIVDYEDQEAANRVMKDLRVHTNIRVEYSNKSAQSGNRYLVDDRTEAAGVTSEDESLPSELKNSSTQALVPGGRTIYVTQLGGKDKADIKTLCLQLPGFHRIQFGQTNFRVVFKDSESASQAMLKIKRLVRSWRASFARKEPEQKLIADIGEPSKVLWTSTLYWTEAELRKYLEMYPGFDRLDYDTSHSWIHFADVSSARAALTDMNSTTNLYSVFSSKRFELDERTCRQLGTIPPANTSDAIPVAKVSAESDQRDRSNDRHAWESGEDRAPSRDGKSLKTYQDTELPSPNHSSTAQPPRNSNLTIVTSEARLGSKMLFAGEDTKKVASSPGAEHFPTRRITAKPREIISNIIIIRNSSTNEREELETIFQEYPNFEGLACEQKGSFLVWFCRFADLESAATVFHSYELREKLGKGYGGVSFQYCGTEKVPLEWKDFLVEIDGPDDDQLEGDTQWSAEHAEDDSFEDVSGSLADPWSLPPSQRQSDPEAEVAVVSASSKNWDAITDGSSAKATSLTSPWEASKPWYESVDEEIYPDQVSPVFPNEEVSDHIVSTDSWGDPTAPIFDAGAPEFVPGNANISCHEVPSFTEGNPVHIYAPAEVEGLYESEPIHVHTSASLARPSIPEHNTKHAALLSENTALRKKLSNSNFRISRAESELQRLEKLLTEVGGVEEVLEEDPWGAPAIEDRLEATLLEEKIKKVVGLVKGLMRKIEVSE
ncbi:uncharacterized protein SPPG_07367 [Spizellomyces punctatus DAOM BR117]|uniref:Uncharacterized protein n=1 Tax=Spizellomyces punctatus (strain DAOM BR117) TaxID=645134 RepID=A0A0L0H8W9_SPIPD|nr:uncharacterized protein SPPG_07367 [Spizellomyces punctatus DAOM BR117]KNC97446.1 hypothetical protein SPPG_07367 [Spizellomyces punctatus DAOM BR117]|eukprot:XP_016605486.1 hypothetical protein SPPG_07367 [Spizellomyces punctatus DAOM BR117]